MKALPLASLLVLVACASGPKPEAVHYPTLPPPTGTAAGEAGFEPAAGLQTLSPTCRASELPVANALDDDCNGRIDDGLPGVPVASADTLVLALSYPQFAALRVELKSGDKPALELNASDCTPESAFCTRLLSASELLRGESTLLVDGAAVQAAAPPTLVVSIQARGKVTTYLAPVTIGSSGQVVGKLFLP